MFPFSTSILVVDDSPVMVSIIQSELSKLGYTNIQTVSDGRAALTLIETAEATGTPIELMFVDWNMPELTGIELLSKVRALPLSKSSAFIMVTSLATKNEVITAIQKGATGYILKPFSAQSISEALGRAWQTRQKKLAA